MTEKRRSLLVDERLGETEWGRTLSCVEKVSLPLVERAAVGGAPQLGHPPLLVPRRRTFERGCVVCS